MSRSELFRKATTDTRTAWNKTNLSKRLVQSRLDQLDEILTTGNAEAISKLLLEISHSPFASLAAHKPINDGKMMKMCEYFMTAMLEGQVQKREVNGGRLDLKALQEEIIKWIDSDDLPTTGGTSLLGITKLIRDTPEVRVTLSAPFASPIEFSMLALATPRQVATPQAKPSETPRGPH